MRGGRRIAVERGLEPAVKRTRRHAAAPRIARLECDLHQRVEALAGLPRHGEQRHALDLRQPLVQRLAHPLEQARLVGGDVPFVERDDEAPAFAEHQIGDAQVLRFEPQRRVEQQHDDLGEVDRVLGIGDRHFLELVDDPRALAQACGIDQAHGAAFVFPRTRDAVARDARLGADDEAVLPEQAVDQRRLARVGTPDDGELERHGVTPRLLGLGAFVGLLLGQRIRCDDRIEDGHQRLVQVGEPLAVLGRDLDRRTEPELVRFGDAALARPPLGLVGDQQHLHVVRPQPLREVPIEWRDAGARIEDQQRDIGLAQRRVGLRTHPPRQARGVGILEACGVDDGEVEVEQLRGTLAPVARHAGRIVDQRQLAPDEAVEQRRLADIGAADEDDCWLAGGHVGRLAASARRVERGGPRQGRGLRRTGSGDARPAVRLGASPRAANEREERSPRYARPRQRSPIRCQLAIVGQQIHRAARDDRR